MLTVAEGKARLLSGRIVDSDSPEWAHECLARHIFNLPRLKDRRAFLYGEIDAKGVARGGLLQKRGPAAVARMEATLMELYHEREAREQLVRELRQNLEPVPA